MEATVDPFVRLAINDDPVFGKTEVVWRTTGNACWDEYFYGDPWDSCQDLAAEDFRAWLADFEKRRAQETVACFRHIINLPKDLCDNNSAATTSACSRAASIINSSILSTTTELMPPPWAQSSDAWSVPRQLSFDSLPPCDLDIFEKDLSSKLEDGDDSTSLHSDCDQWRSGERSTFQSAIVEAVSKQVQALCVPKLDTAEDVVGFPDDQASRLATRRYMLRACMTPVGER